MTTTWALHYGKSRKPLAHVVQDATYPTMWRIAWPDGRQSDMVNLSRAKDAAAAIAERGPPARDRKMFHWGQRPRNSGQRPPTARQA
jgi:hypothetical protein